MALAPILGGVHGQVNEPAGFASRIRTKLGVGPGKRAYRRSWVLVRNISGYPTNRDLTQLQSLESLQPVDKRALVVTNEGAEEAL